MSAPQHFDRPPLIGICARVMSFADEGRRDAFSSSQPYSRAVSAAGGIPMLLPPLPTASRHVQEILDRLDGVMLPGGGDVEPYRYGQEPMTDSLYGMVGVHDEIDLALAHAVLDRDIPTLALCRGMQILNVAMGGTLHQDLHVEGHWMQEHGVTIAAGSLLAKATGVEALRHCYSLHHQGLDHLGDHLTPVAWSDDGLIEAIEHNSASWVVGVQWHPEDTTMTEFAQQRLFDEFVAQAAARV